MLNHSLELFMNKSILVLNKTVSVKVAARSLFERQVGCAIVCDDEGHMVGLVTDRDLTCLVIGFELPDTTSLEEVMASDIFCIDTTAPLSTAVLLMEDNGVRRIPIIETLKNGHQKCVGLISLDDLVLYECIDTQQISRIVRSQIAISGPLKNWSTIHDHARDHVLNRFFKIMSHAIELPRSTTEIIVTKLLMRIVQRLGLGQSVYFISQLPYNLQHYLLTLEQDPDCNIDHHVILSDITQRFQILQHEAEIIVQKFWSGLKEIIDPHVLKQISRQLPESITDLFEGTTSSQVEDIIVSFELE